jgi:septation ring formation regulator EzrA
MDKSKLKNKIKEVEECMEQMTLEHEEVVKVKDDKIDELRELILKQDQEREKDRQYMRSLGISIEEVKDQNDGLHKQVKKVQRKLGIAVEDRAPFPEDESKRERFVLLKLNDDEYYPYYIIRTTLSEPSTAIPNVSLKPSLNILQT